MSTDAGATLTAVIGVVLVRLAAEGTFRRYVRPGMGPWLAVAGVLLALLGIVVLWRHRRGDDDHSAHEHGGEQVRVAAAGAGARAAAHRSWRPRLLLTRSHRIGGDGEQRGGVFARSTRTPRPHEMSLLEFDQRAFEGTDGASFNGARVRLVGFVGPAKGEGFLVARYSIACCAADALAATAHVVGWNGPVPARDTWVEVEGTFEPGGEVNPRLVAASVTPIPEPDDPYE